MKHYTRWITVGFACVVVLLYGLSWACCLLSSEPFFSTLFLASAAVVALLVPLAMACVFWGRFLTAVGLWWDWAVLKWTIGYGVYAHRVLVAAVCVILFFALAYASCIYLTSGMGDIIQGRRSITEGHPIEVIRRLVYFSGVTFSTLGYGDYKPTEWVQLVAVTESLLGAVTIALVVVVFARKFIRR